MQNRGKIRYVILSFVNYAIFLGLSIPMAVFAQNESTSSSAAKPVLEEVLVTGTRQTGRTATQSPVPIDSFDKDEILKHGSGDLNDIISTLVPSFNVQQQPISDGSSFVRPISMRGLAPDHTLVLVNGKRFHRAALVNLTPGSGSQGRGTQGPDVANFPSIALERIEVLRDGAAAQYGSDAIAGVVNFILRDNPEGLEFNAQYGKFYENEDEYKINGNLGLPLGDDGFLNISVEVSGTDELSRGEQHDAAIAILDADPNLSSEIDDPVQVWGRTENDSYRSVWNGAVSIGNGDDEIYGFGNYSQTEATGSFFYRPITGVVEGVGRADVFGVDNNGNCIQFCDLFPGGFTPRLTGTVSDFSQVIGFRGERDKFTYDISYNFGRNELDYFLRNSVNPALGDQGPNTQTDFDVGDLEERDQSINFDLTYSFTKDIHLAAGAEWRKETYEITAGERASWDGNPELAAQGFAVGSNGFGGFSPDVAGEFDRHNVAFYIDGEWDVNEDLLISGAVRFEEFSDFGSTTNGKIAGRYNINNRFALRAAASTGFKAPTIGQRSTSQISTQFFDDPETGEILQRQVATLRVDNPAAIIMGATPLDAEDSYNLSGGFTYGAGQTTFTVDYYYIEIEDRIGLSKQLTPNKEQAAALNELDITQNFSRIAFFTNAFDTETQGIDVVAKRNFTVFEDHLLAVNLAYAWNDTEVKNVDGTVLDRDHRLELEDGLPAHQGSIGLKYNMDNWEIFVRMNYFGEVLNASNTPALDEINGAEVTFDMEITYDVNDNYNLTVGAKNLFDEFPDRTSRTTGPVTTGLPFFRQSPMGFNGGMAYLRFNAQFN